MHKPVLITYELSANAVQLIVEALGALPYKRVAGLIEELVVKANKTLEEAAAAAPEETQE
jgi:cell division inhibitor SulA